MFYLLSKNILIEILIEKDHFWIGDQAFSELPTYIFAQSFQSASWNRALKFEVQTKKKQQSQTFYFMLELDFFLTSNNFQVLTKHFFFNQIIQSDLFLNHFVKKVFKHYFKNNLIISKKLANEIEFINQYKPSVNKNNLRVVNINRFILLDPDFSTYSKKFQVLFVFKKQKTFSWLVNNKNQLVYNIPWKSFNELIDQSFLLDLTSKSFQLNRQSRLIENLAFEFEITNHSSAKIVGDYIKQIFLESNDVLKNWHLFNLTNEINYIIDDLKTQKESCNDLKTYLENILKTFKQNYLELLLKQEKIKELVNQ